MAVTVHPEWLGWALSSTHHHLPGEPPQSWQPHWLATGARRISCQGQSGTSGINYSATVLCSAVFASCRFTA